MSLKSLEGRTGVGVIRWKIERGRGRAGKELEKVSFLQRTSAGQAGRSSVLCNLVDRFQFLAVPTYLACAAPAQKSPYHTDANLLLFETGASGLISMGRIEQSMMSMVSMVLQFNVFALEVDQLKVKSKQSCKKSITVVLCSCARPSLLIRG